MEESKVKLSLDDFKELIQRMENTKEDNNLLNINNITQQNKVTDDDTIDWSPWFKAIHGR